MLGYAEMRSRRTAKPRAQGGRKQRVEKPHNLTWTRGKGEMKRLVATTYLMIALIGPGLAQDVAAVGKKAKPKQSSECRPVGTVKGTKLWAGNCVAPELAAAPAAEPESEPETKDAIRGSK